MCDSCHSLDMPFLCCATQADLKNNQFSYSLPIKRNAPLTPVLNLYEKSLKECGRYSLSSDMAEITIDDYSGNANSSDAFTTPPKREITNREDVEPTFTVD